VSPPPDLSNASDQEVVAWARQGREEGYSELVHRYRRPVYSLIHRLVRDPETAEDLTQESFVKVINALDSYRPESRLSAWILRIANNTAVDYLRRHRLDTLSLDGSPYADTPGETAATALQVAAPSNSTPTPAGADPEALRSGVEQALRRLPGKVRRCFVLRDIEGLSYEHIAEVLGLPVGTACAYIHRARNQLKHMLGPLRESLQQHSPCTPV
jgi:RNA polymerase sigma-70 factor (ECF subfamily)